MTYNGETYRAATAKDGPRSRIVFDTGGRRFRSLLPSIRVELDGNARIGEVAELLGAVRVTRFYQLGGDYILYKPNGPFYDRFMVSGSFPVARSTSRIMRLPKMVSMTSRSVLRTMVPGTFLFLFGV